MKYIPQRIFKILRPVIIFTIASFTMLDFTFAGSVWVIPMGGNSYVASGSGGDSIGRNGFRWESQNTVISVFFHVDQPGDLELSLRLRVPYGRSTIEAKIGGALFKVTAQGSNLQDVRLGTVNIEEAGYQRLDLRGISKSQKDFAHVSDLVVAAAIGSAKISFVRSNDGDMFYWGRRGPSVHLHYLLPRNRRIEYAYSEITVPAGDDPPGSFFMANGFGEGYFGIQVKSPTERQLIFSVWSPHQTDRPSEIPKDKQVIALKRSEGVRINEFGGEGAGGQSLLPFSWRTGITYKFLTSVKPDGNGSTVYTSWFGEAESPNWRLIASFKRPETNTYLTGFHSFVENFYDTYGYRHRGAVYGNQQVRDTEGNWHKINRARFTGDTTAIAGHRLDYAGGVSQDRFFLRSGGFFNERVSLDRDFEVRRDTNREPSIDFSKLEGVN